MKVKFKECHSSEEVMESVAGIIKLFEERYGISHFRDVELDVVLMNDYDEDVEIIDAHTEEVFDIFEVHKTLENKDTSTPYLRLAVDNTIH